MHRFIWLIAVAATGVGAGLLTTHLGSRLTRLSPGQCIWLPIVTASVMWLVAGAIAEYGFRTTPWGWAGHWSNNLMASTAWLGMAELISIRVFDSRLREPS
jgi:hypothetical protein